MASFRRHTEFCEKCNEYVDVLFTSTDVDTAKMTKTINVVCSKCYGKIRSVPDVAYRCDSV